jgi:hypothetical protein
MRDAYAAELAEEPTIVLEALVAGSLDSTWITRELAQTELDFRRLCAQAVEDAGKAGV